MRSLSKQIGALCLITLVPQLSFGLMRRMELRDLTAEATHIIIGTVLEARAGWTPAGSIETRVTILIEDRLMGDLDGNVVRLSVPGGEVGEIGLAVSDMPRFVEGTRVLVYVGLSEREPPYVVGLEQGRFTLDRGKVLENGMNEREFLERVRAEVRARQETK